MMRRAAALLATLALAACSSEDTGVFVDAFVDEMRGATDAEALAPSAQFDEGGIAFAHPALLRRRERRDDDGSRTWKLERGMFTLELYAPRAELTADDYLGALAGILAGGERVDADAPNPGRAASICGHDLTSTVVRFKLMGDWSEIEGFDLPAPPGESRILLIDDEPVDGKPSTVAAATRERVLASIRCDASFARRDAD